MRTGNLVQATLLLASITALSMAQPYQPGDFKAPRTTAAERARFAREEREDKVLARLAKPLTADTQKDWAGAFWTAGLLNERGPEVQAAIERCLAGFEGFDADFQEVVLRSVYTLYPDDYARTVGMLLDKTKTDKAFATAAYYVLAADDGIETRFMLSRKLAERYPLWSSQPRLAMLWHDLGALEYPPMPPLAELLSHDYYGKAVVFSLQRRDRRYPGLVIVRDTKGAFLRNEDGSLLTIPQLAMSRTNMPGTITFGNSPEGLYVITESGVSSNVFIGPTPYLYSKVPVEAGVEEFTFGHAAADQWDLDVYTSLLPPAWRGYFPFHEAWYAGKAGRSEMLMHGTTINPEFYRDEIYYPFTPSAGCLCTPESWSAEDGSLKSSAQVDLLNAFHRAGDGTGYLILVELDDARNPVTPAEAEEIVRNSGE